MIDWWRKYDNTNGAGPIVGCEEPMFMTGEAGIAARGQGSVTAMAHMAGIVHGWCVENEYEFRSVSIPKWKGNLDKTITTKRIHRLLGDTDKTGKVYSSHGADAVGIAFGAHGIYMDNNDWFLEKPKASTLTKRSKNNAKKISS